MNGPFLVIKFPPRSNVDSFISPINVCGWISVRLFARKFISLVAKLRPVSETNILGLSSGGGFMLLRFHDALAFHIWSK